MMDPQHHRPSNADSSEFPRRANEARRALRITEEDGRQSDELVATRTSLEREKQKYYELFQLAPDAYFVTDVRGAIRESNAAASNLLGVAPEFLRGKSLLNFLDESARRHYSQQLDRLCGSDRVDDWETSVTSRAGKLVPVSVSIGQMHGPDRKVAGYRWIVRDITSRKLAESAVRELNRELEIRVASRTTQLAAAHLVKDELLLSEKKAREEAETANRVKSEFLALLSHEFRTPLQAVFGYTELLEREIHGPLNEHQHRYVERIQQSQQHLLGVINTILDFASLEAGQPIEVDLQPVRIDALLQLMEPLVGPLLETKQINYEYADRGPPVLATADATKVQQIVLNLVSNAIKFTDRGGYVTLLCAADGDTVSVHVKDTGIGIPSDKLDVIFEPFIRIRSRTNLAAGTGLGLSISRRLAEAMGGSLTVVSEPGHGSTFTLRLPLAKGPQ
jgi:PAS domain S-box-containing protein